MLSLKSFKKLTLHSVKWESVGCLELWPGRCTLPLPHLSDDDFTEPN